MDTAKRLAEIWSEDYIGTLPAPVKERGYWFVDNIQKEILINKQKYMIIVFIVCILENAINML